MGGTEPTNRRRGGLSLEPRLDGAAVRRAPVGVAGAAARLLCSQSGSGLVAGHRGAAPPLRD